MERRPFPKTLDQRFFAAFLDCLGNRLAMVRSAQGWLHLEDPQFADLVERFRRSSLGYEELDEARKEFVVLLLAAAAMAAWDAHEEYTEGAG